MIMCNIASLALHGEAKVDKTTNAPIASPVGNIGLAEEDVQRPAKREGGEESCGRICFNRGIGWQRRRQRIPLR